MIKSIPVASFIIICLIWMSSSRLSIVISFLMVLPIVYTNVLQSIQQRRPGNCWKRCPPSGCPGPSGHSTSGFPNSSPTFSRPAQ